jgi:rhodanese-related sulfurtransferase
VFGRVPEISVEDLKTLRDEGASVVLVDVREPREYAVSDLPASVKIPLGTLPNSLEKIGKQDDLIVYCRSGARSAQAVQFLLANGYARARNLAGGINRWAELIDPSMQKYRVSSFEFRISSWEEREIRNPKLETKGGS